MQTEHDQLFHLAYERAKVDEGRLEPHVWSFRSRITVDHLRNSIRKKEMVKILNAFLEAVSLINTKCNKNHACLCLILWLHVCMDVISVTGHAKCCMNMK